MKILAIEKESVKATSNLFAPHLKDEAIKVLELYEKGLIREIYFDQSHCAIIILECDNLNTAIEELNKLPLVQKGLITFEVRELKPYTGFSRILS